MDKHIEHELNRLGVISIDHPLFDLPEDQKPIRRYPEPTGWMPKYPGEEPPF